MTPRTICIIERCEFGEPGDVVCPEPHDIAALLVNRGLAAYAEELGGGKPSAPVAEIIDSPRRESRPRKHRDRSSAD